MYLFWKDFAGPIATVIASIAAVTVSVKFQIIQSRIGRDQAATAAAQKDIAKGQLDIARERVKQNLFEKRFVIFEIARQFLIEAVQGGHVDAREVMEFNTKTADAIFLFDADIVTYLETLRARVVQLRQFNIQIKALDDEEAERHVQRRGVLVDKAAELHTELSAELPVMIEAFRGYLKLGDI